MPRYTYAVVLDLQITTIDVGSQNFICMLIILLMLIFERFTF